MDLRDTEAGTLIRVRVTPNASRNELSEDSEGRLSVRLTSPPVEGRANKELVKLLGKKLKVAPSSILIVKGQGSREKTLLIEGMSRDQVLEKLG
jgi:uncharacterized protein